MSTEEVNKSASIDNLELAHTLLMSRVEMEAWRNILKKSSLFGEMLEFYIARRRVSQREISEKIGVTPSAVSHLVRGRRQPDAFFVYKIAKVLDLSPSEIVTLLETVNVDAAAHRMAAYIDVAIKDEDIRGLSSVVLDVLGNIVPRNSIAKFSKEVKKGLIQERDEWEARVGRMEKWFYGEPEEVKRMSEEDKSSFEFMLAFLSGFIREIDKKLQFYPLP